MKPSLVMCPMSSTGTPLRLAKRRSSAATSRIWLTEPGADSTASLYMVCTESTTIRSGELRSASSITSSMRVSQNIVQPNSSPPRREERILTCLSLSSPLTYRVLRPLQ